ncbi:hypothetical protein LJR130_003028 [Variovorax sp. LjRoot130]
MEAARSSGFVTDRAASSFGELGANDGASGAGGQAGIGQALQLQTRGHEADQRARNARGEATIILMACAFGGGAAPPLEQLDSVSQQERTADWMRLEMDAHILKAFA